MPSGYTDKVGQGQTFQQFAMGCARAFGALVMMREDEADVAIPERFEPSPYYRDKLAEAEKELAWVSQMPATEAAREAAAQYAKEAEYHERTTRERTELLAKYQAMLLYVQNWVPPTPEHDGLKNFMVDQLTESINFDCGTDPQWNPEPVLKTADEWKVERLATVTRNVVLYQKEWSEEVERTERRNVWITALRGAL